MKIGNIISGAKLFAGRTACRIRVHSPEILIGLGVIGLVGSTVLACKATTKAHLIKEEMENSLKEIRDIETDESMSERYSKEDAVQDKKNVLIKAVVKMTGLYAPSILLGGCSIMCILLSHKIMCDRTAAAIALGNTALAGLSEYRSRIAEKIGKDEEEAIYRDISKEKRIESKSYSDTDGSGKLSETEEECMKIVKGSGYAQLIDPSCGIWDRNSDMTLMSLHGVLRHLNDKLVARATGTKPGYLFLREVYEELEIPRDQWRADANLVGWLYDKNNKSLHNFVDFGPMYLLTKSDLDENYYIRATDPGNDRDVLIEFNIDGIIYDCI